MKNGKYLNRSFAYAFVFLSMMYASASDAACPVCVAAVTSIASALGINSPWPITMILNGGAFCITGMWFSSFDIFKDSYFRGRSLLWGSCGTIVATGVNFWFFPFVLAGSAVFWTCVGGFSVWAARVLSKYVVHKRGKVLIPLQTTFFALTALSISSCIAFFINAK